MDTAQAARAGTTVIGILLVGLAISGAVALVTAPIVPRLARAETTASRADPTMSHPLRASSADTDRTAAAGR